MDGLDFNVAHLLRQPIGAAVKHPIDTRDCLELDGVPVQRLVGNAQLIRTNFGILGRARLRALVGLECDRCLEEYVASVLTEFAEEYLPIIDVSTGRPVQSERTDETFFISPNHIVDLTEAARQHLLLAVPMHRICREECRGLCPTCGTNRNLRDCECIEQEEDHPLSSLATILREASGGRRAD